jgi:hypothetical protein
MSPNDVANADVEQLHDVANADVEQLYDVKVRHYRLWLLLLTTMYSMTK